MQPREHGIFRQEQADTLQKEIGGVIDDSRKNKADATLDFKRMINEGYGSDAWKKKMCTLIDNNLFLIDQQNDVLLYFRDYQRLDLLTFQYNTDLKSRLYSYERFVTDNKSSLLTTHFSDYVSIIANISRECKLLLEPFNAIEKLKVSYAANTTKAINLKNQFLSLEAALIALDPAKEKGDIREISSGVVRRIMWDQVLRLFLTSRNMLFDLFDIDNNISMYKNQFFDANKQEYMLNMSRAKAEVDQYLKISEVKKAKDAAAKGKQELGHFKPAPLHSTSMPTHPAQSSMPPKA